MRLVVSSGLGNHLDEAEKRRRRAVFDSICNSRWFVRTSIILFLNKVRCIGFRFNFAALV